ncbi:unnamed protein product [Lota lota]
MTNGPIGAMLATPGSGRFQGSDVCDGSMLPQDEKEKEKEEEEEKQEEKEKEKQEKQEEQQKEKEALNPGQS